MELDYNKGLFDYRNQENYNKKRPGRKERSEWEGEYDESMTVPGEALTILQIMERAQTGRPLPGQDLPYFDQEDMDMIRNFPIDLTDLDETRRELDDLQSAVDEAIAERDAEEPEEPEEPPVVDGDPLIDVPE